MVEMNAGALKSGKTRRVNFGLPMNPTQAEWPRAAFCSPAPRTSYTTRCPAAATRSAGSDICCA